MISFIFSFNPWVRKTIASLYLVVIAILSLLPAYDIPNITLFVGADKLVHMFMYLGLSVLVAWSYEIGRHGLRFFYALLTGVFLYGVLMEILQRTMHNGRDFDFRDMLANLSGAILGFMIYKYFERKYLKKVESDSTDQENTVR